MREYTVPRAYNLLDDPGETKNAFWETTWVYQDAMTILGQHKASLITEGIDK